MGIIFDMLKDMPLSAVLRERLQDLETKYNELEIEKSKLQDENAKLKSENGNLQARLRELSESSKLCQDEIDILIFLSSCGTEPTAEMISQHLNLNLTKTEYYLKRMLKKYVNSYDYVRGTPSEYYLLQKGREYLVENNLIGN